MGDSEELIERARRLLDNATPGPWGPMVYRGTGLGWDVDGPEAGIRGQFDAEGDAKFIAAAPELVSGLLAEVERLRGELLELGGKLPSDRREALVATYAYEAGMEDARDELAARSDTEPTVTISDEALPFVEDPSHDTEPDTCPTCRSTQRAARHTGRWWRRSDGELLNQHGRCPDGWHAGSVGSGEQS